MTVRFRNRKIISEITITIAESFYEEPEEKNEDDIYGWFTARRIDFYQAVVAVCKAADLDGLKIDQVSDLDIMAAADGDDRLSYTLHLHWYGNEVEPKGPILKSLLFKNIVVEDEAQLLNALKGIEYVADVEAVTIAAPYSIE